MLQVDVEDVTRHLKGQVQKAGNLVKSVSLLEDKLAKKAASNAKLVGLGTWEVDLVHKRSALDEMVPTVTTTNEQVCGLKIWDVIKSLIWLLKLGNLCCCECFWR